MILNLPESRLETLGAIQPLSSTSLLDLSRQDTVWVVLEGKLDAFVALQSPHQELGARHHFLRVEPGEAFFGIEPHDPSLFLGASAPAGTKVLSLQASTFEELLRHKDEWAIALLENWVTAVAARIFTPKPPASVLDVTPSQSIAVQERPRAVISTGAVLWAQHLKGSSIPFSDEILPAIEEEMCFPLSRSSWLLVQPGSKVRFLASADTPPVAPAHALLRPFHTVTLQALLRERQRSRDQEHSRIRRKSSSDSAFVERGLIQLSDALRHGRVGVKSRSACTDPLFLAFEAAGAQLGIPVTAPPELLRGEPVPNLLAAIARSSSIRVRKVVLRGEWWKNNSGPLIAFAEQGSHPMALLRSSAGMDQFNPADGTIVNVNERVASSLNPLAYAMYRAFPREVVTTGGLLRFGLSGCRYECSLIIGTSLAMGLLSIILPLATGILFDRLIPGAERGQLIQMTIFLFIIAFATSVFMLTRGFAVLRLQGKLDAVLQAAVWDRLLDLPVSFFRDYSSGDLAQRSMGIAQIREILTGSALNALLSGVFSVFSFALLFFYNVQLAIIATGFVLAGFLVSVVTGLLQIRQGRGMLRVSGALSSKLLQLVSGITKLRVTGTEGRAFSEWAHDFSAQKSISIGIRRVTNALAVFNSIFPSLALAAIFFANSRIHNLDGSIGLRTGDLLAFLAAFTQFLVSALTLSSTVLSLTAIIPIYDRTKPILSALPEVTNAKADPGILSGEIEINHVSFAYRPDLPLVLRNLTLHVTSGQSVAFVGPSGCGKSTVLRLLLGFESPGSGSVYFDGQDLAGLDSQAVRRQMGVVLQSSRLMSGSIFENIAGSLPLTVDDVWEACRLSGLEEDIRRMPMGLHTNITDGSGGISGGQRQRLLIARAIVRRPKILFFDEATSALDNHTQAIVTRSLTALRVTRVIIAHRLSTVAEVDRIYVFEKGTIVESGTYASLMERGGAFFQLAKRQLS